MAKNKKDKTQPERGDSNGRNNGGTDAPVAATGKDGPIEFQAAEIELLLKVCQKYRSTLPAHLLSSKDETALADELLDKLQKYQSAD